MFVRLFVVLVCPNAHMHAQPEKIKNQMATIAASISLDDDEPKAAASMASRVCIARLFLTVTLFLQRQHQKLRPHCPRRRHQQMPQGSYRPHPRRQKKMRRITKLRPNRRAHIFFFWRGLATGEENKSQSGGDAFFERICPNSLGALFLLLVLFFFPSLAFPFLIKKTASVTSICTPQNLFVFSFFFFSFTSHAPTWRWFVFLFSSSFFFFLHFPPSSYRYTKRKKKTHGKY